MQKIWQNNFYLLKNLEPNQKLIVINDGVNDGELTLDQRYFQWFRRRFARNGPSELIEPIKKTFENTLETYVDIVNVLKHLQLVLDKTYPGDTSGLLSCVNDLYEHYRQHLPKSSDLLSTLLSPSEFHMYCSVPRSTAKSNLIESKSV